MEKLQILDTDRIDMLFGGDLSMVQEIYSIASDDFPVVADRLFEALTANDLEAAAGFAHTLKGSISNVGGERASRIADKIQQAAMQQDLSAVPRSIRCSGPRWNRSSQHSRVTRDWRIDAGPYSR